VRKVHSGSYDEYFERVLVAEVKSLKRDEGRLKRLYPRLRNQPKLQERFQVELAELQQRLDRLDAVLNPVYAFRPASIDAAPTLSPAA